MTDFARASSLLSSASLDREELFPIREVSRLTGVNPVTLRAWERRYGLIQPTRTESGHRLYSMADIEAVRSILAWTERGVAVSKVGSILARSAETRAVAPEQPEAVSGEWAEWQAQVQQAVSSFDDARLEQVYGQVFSTYPVPVVFQDVLMPLWQQLLPERHQYVLKHHWHRIGGKHLAVNLLEPRVVEAAHRLLHLRLPLGPFAAHRFRLLRRYGAGLGAARENAADLADRNAALGPGKDRAHGFDIRH